VKNGNGDLLADSYNIYNGWKNRFPQLLIVYRVSDVRQIHIAEPLLTEPSLFEVEITIAKFKTYK
jgi:hypothetical protein